MLEGKVAVIYGAGSIGSAVGESLRRGRLPCICCQPYAGPARCPRRRDPNRWRRGANGDDDDPAIGQGIVDATIIGRAATYEDVGNVAVFAASDQARMMTAATLNISGGAVID